MEIHALWAQGWTISAIARHVGVHRKTVAEYLSEARFPGAGARDVPEVFGPFVDYCRVRLADDPHLLVVTLYEEVRELGYRGAYSTFTRAVRELKLRPRCEACAAARERDHAIIDHPAGEQTRWDWLELPDPPAAWGLRAQAHLLIGALSHSGKWRGVITDAEDPPQLVETIDTVVRRLGGLTRRWRFVRMTTVPSPTAGLTAAFAAVAKHYQVVVDVCPPRRGDRKTVVDKAIHSAVQHWWRTLPDDVPTVEAAQSTVDKLATLMDQRRRTINGVKATVAELAAGERLHPPPQTPGTLPPGPPAL